LSILLCKGYIIISEYWYQWRIIWQIKLNRLLLNLRQL
jgi:hypothetical protein